MATAAIKAAEVPKLPPGELVPEVSLAPTSPTAETDAGGVSPVNPDHPRETLPTRPTISVPGPGADSASDGASVDAAPVVVPPKPTEEGDAVSERNKQEFRERDARIVLAARVHDQPEFWFITAGRDLDEMERKKLYRIEKFTTLEEYHRNRGLLMQTTGHWRKLARAYDEMVAAGYTPPTMKAVHFEAVAGLPVARKFQILTAASMDGRITEKRIESEIAKMLALDQPRGVETRGVEPIAGGKIEGAGNARDDIGPSGDETNPGATIAGPTNGHAANVSHPGGNAARRAPSASVVGTTNSGRFPEFRSVASFSDDELLKCKALFSVELTNQLLKMRQIAEAAVKRVGIHRYDAIEFFERMMKR